MTNEEKIVEEICLGGKNPVNNYPKTQKLKKINTSD